MKTKVKGIDIPPRKEESPKKTTKVKAPPAVPRCAYPRVPQGLRRPEQRQEGASPPPPSDDEAAETQKRSSPKKRPLRRPSTASGEWKHVWKNKMAFNNKRSAVWDHTKPSARRPATSSRARRRRSQSPLKQMRRRSASPQKARSANNVAKASATNAALLWFHGASSTKEHVGSITKKIIASHTEYPKFANHLKMLWTSESISALARSRAEHRAAYVQKSISSLVVLEQAVKKAETARRVLLARSCDESDGADSQGGAKRGSRGQQSRDEQREQERFQRAVKAKSKQLENLPEIHFVRRALGEALETKTPSCDLFARYTNALASAMCKLQDAAVTKVLSSIGADDGNKLSIRDFLTRLPTTAPLSSHEKIVIAAHFDVDGDGYVSKRELELRLEGKLKECSDFARHVWVPHSTSRFRALKSVFSDAEFEDYVRELGEALTKIYSGITWTGAAAGKGIFRLFQSMDTGATPAVREPGTWYDGSVSKVRPNGTVDVQYVEGDSELRVQRHHLRLPMPPGSPRRAEFRKGTIVKVHRGGKWIVGKITKVYGDGFFDIQASRGSFMISRIQKKFVRELSNTLDDHEDVCLAVGDAVQVQHRKKTGKTYKLASDGRLSRAELGRGLRKVGVELSKAEEDLIYEHFDDEGDGTVDLRELCDALLDVGPSAAVVEKQRKWQKRIQAAAIRPQDKTWSEHIDPKSGMPFWYCEITGERTWNKPCQKRSAEQGQSRKEEQQRVKEMCGELEEEIERARNEMESQLKDLAPAMPVLSVAEIALEKLPECIGAFKFTYALWAPCNCLSSITSSLGGMGAALKILNLSNNALSSLPRAISSLKGLELFDVSHNKISLVPHDTFASMKNLAAINFEENCMHAISFSLMGLEKLGLLNMRRNKLTAVPSTIQCLANLESLLLAGNRITQIPESIKSLQSLTHAELNDNALPAIPQNLCRLKSLRNLLLHNNELECLPADIGNLAQLRILTLQKNHLRNIPESLCNLKHLSALSAHWNHLLELPGAFGRLVSLKTLHLHCNKLTQLPSSFSDLKMLTLCTLFSNNLLSLPDNFGSGLAKLKTLKLHGNKLRVLPPSIGSISLLQSLNVSKNALTSLPSTFAVLDALVDLQVTGNMFADEALSRVLGSGVFSSRDEKDMRILMKKLLDGLSMHETRKSAEKYGRFHPFSEVEMLERERAAQSGRRSTAAKKRNSRQLMLYTYIEAFDRNLDGRLTRQAFTECMRTIGTLMYEKEVEAMVETAFRACRVDESGCIEYDSFVDSAVFSQPERNVARAAVKFFKAKQQPVMRSDVDVGAQNVELADKICREREAIKRLEPMLDEDQKRRFKDTLKAVHASRASHGSGQYDTFSDKYKALQIQSKLKKELQLVAAARRQLAADCKLKLSGKQPKGFQRQIKSKDLKGAEGKNLRNWYIDSPGRDR